MKKEIKKCPFCGGEARLKMENKRDVGWTIWGECKSCYAKTTGYCVSLKSDTALEDIERCKEKASEAWNRRVKE